MLQLSMSVSRRVTMLLRSTISIFRKFFVYTGKNTISGTLAWISRASKVISIAL